MKIRPTIERRRERQEFVYKYRKELEFIIDHGWNNERKAFVEKHARPELMYKSSTYYLDIWCTLKRDFIKLFNRKW